MRIGCALGSLLFLTACTSEPTFLDDPVGPPPETMAELGLYSGNAAHPSAHDYQPVYPLWSSGTEKERFVHLPREGTIEVAADGTWTFPNGAYFFKTFSWRGERIETRVLWQQEGVWDYAVYQWEGEEASLVDLAVSHSVQLQGDEGAFEYEIPSRRQCRTCHESSDSPVLGFSSLQLDPDEQLANLIPPTNTELGAPDPLTAEVLGYMEGNCVHCHNGITEFDLSHEVALENLIDQPTRASGVEVGTRVVPGDADASVLFRVFAGESSTRMPPLGVQRRDEAMVVLLEEWIDALED